MSNIAELVFIQAFIAKASVKALNTPVLRRLAQLNKLKLHTTSKEPRFQRTAGKLRPLICSYCCQIAMEQRNAAQNTRYLNTRYAERQTFLNEIIYTGQTLDPASGDQRIRDKIHRLGQVGSRRTQ